MAHEDTPWLDLQDSIEKIHGDPQWREEAERLFRQQRIFERLDSVFSDGKRRGGQYRVWERKAKVQPY
jgi:hypothetical protein